MTCFFSIIKVICEFSLNFLEVTVCIVKNVQWYHLYVSRGLIKPIKSAFINKSNTKFSCPISLINSVTKTNIKILIRDIYP